VEITPEELPTAPVLYAVPIDYVLLGLAAGIAVVALASAVITSVKHVVEEVGASSKKFVRRKRKA